MKHKNLKIFIVLGSIFIISSLAIIMSYDFTVLQSSQGVSLDETTENCEHQFQYKLSPTGGACVKCGGYCCPHENVGWVGNAIVGNLGCSDCGAIFKGW